MKFLLLLFVFFNVVLFSFAGCYTGFACSLSDLEKVKQNEEFNQNLNKYFAKEINADYFFVKKLQQITYNDLFLFNTIL